MDYFGGFSDPLSRDLLRAPCWSVRENLPYGDALAAQYRSTRVAIDIANGPFINGFSPKLFECFASGGFMLTSGQGDISTAIGHDLAGIIGFSGSDELSAKVDHFLAHDRERAEIGREIRSIIRREHTASALLSRTIPEAIEQIRAR
jgi:spore maturation protein CgeB